MSLWIILAVLLAAVLVAVLWPLLRPRAVLANRADFDIEVYLDQLRELERDELRLVYQPRICLHTQKIAGLEAEIERYETARQADAERIARLIAVRNEFVRERDAVIQDNTRLRDLLAAIAGQLESTSLPSSELAGIMDEVDCEINSMSPPSSEHDEPAAPIPAGDDRTPRTPRYICAACRRDVTALPASVDGNTILCIDCTH